MKQQIIKIILIAVLPFLFYSCQNTYSACIKFHEGKFKLVGKELGTTFITRKNNIQTEINHDAGFHIRLSVNWVSDCEYTLKLIEVINNNAKLPFDTAIVLKVEMTELKKNSYIQRSLSDKLPKVYTSEIFRIE